MTPADVLAMAREHNARVADVRFVDLLGTWQHFSVPIEAMMITCSFQRHESLPRMIDNSCL